MNENTANASSDKAQRLAPTTQSNRIDALDILRGIAVIGILFMNIEWFGRSVFSLGTFDTSLTGIDHAAEWLVRCFVEGKFYKLFALLFGMGFAVMLIRARDAGRPFGALFSRRMGVLFIIGMLHMIFLWGGDILHDYAFAGMVLLGWIFLLRRKRFKRFDNPRSTLRMALIWLSIPVVVASIAGIGFGVRFDHEQLTERWDREQNIAVLAKARAELPAELGDEPVDAEPEEGESKPEVTEDERMEKTAERVAKRKRALKSREKAEVDALTQGSYWQATQYRLELAGMMLLFTPMFTIAMLFPMFLLGYWFISSGVLTNHRENQHIFRPMAWLGMIFGICFSVGGLLLLQHPAAEVARVLQGTGQMLFFTGQFVLAAGYLGLIVTLLGSPAWSKGLRYVSPLGRMALTNYIMHSLILSSIFYGYAGGMYGEISRGPQMLIVVAIVTFQVFFSQWWLKRYRFGPLEWLWRSLTYQSWQPIRIAP